MRWWEWLESSTQAGSSLQHSWPVPAWLTLLAAAACLAWVWRVYRGSPGPHDGGPPSRSDSSRRRVWTPLLLRSGALLLLFWMMIGVTWRRYETELPELLLVVDHSASMGHEDVLDSKRGEISRFEAVKHALLNGDSRRLERLSERYRLRLFTLAQDLRELPEEQLATRLQEAALASKQDASRLGDGIAELLLRQGARSTAAIVLFTDGLTTVGRSLESAATEAQQRNVPLWLAATGEDRVKLDLRLSDLVYQDVVFPDDQVTFEAKLTCEGVLSETTTASVQLLRGTRVVAETQVELAPQDSGNADDPQATMVRLAYRASLAGQQHLTLQAAPLDGEENVENNRMDASIEVRDETIRVLLVSAHPTFDYQFLRNLLGAGLRRDNQADAFALTTVLQDGDPEHHLQDAFAAQAFPATREELFAYDVVIVGDVDANAFSSAQQQSLHAFVAERGGAMVVLSGPEHTPAAWSGTPIEELLPIHPQSIAAPDPGEILERPLRLRLTALGRESAQMRLTDHAIRTDDGGRTANQTAEVWSQLPPIYWCLQSRPKPGVRVLATLAGAGQGTLNEPSPVICTRFFGAGTVLFHATDESYRWSAADAGKQLYSRYWLQTLRYLSRTKLGDDGGVELTTDADRYRQGESPEFRVRFLNASEAPADRQGVSLVLESDGRRRQLRLRRWKDRRAYFSGRAEGLPEGAYRAWLAEPHVTDELPTCTFIVAPPQTEMSRLVVDLDGLQRAAKASGGAIRPLAELDQLLKELPPGRQLRVSPLPPRPLWNSNLVAAAFVGLLTLEWILRRRAWGG